MVSVLVIREVADGLGRVLVGAGHLVVDLFASSLETVYDVQVVL